MFMVSASQYQAAHINAVIPLMSLTPVLAPLSSKIFMIFVCLYIAACISAVLPFLFWAFTLAPAFSKAFTVSASPRLAANISAVLPLLSLVFIYFSCVTEFLRFHNSIYLLLILNCCYFSQYVYDFAAHLQCRDVRFFVQS